VTVDDLDVDEEWKVQVVHGCDGCCAHESFPSFKDSLVITHGIIRRQHEAMKKQRNIIGELQAEANAFWEGQEHG
jgi:hypothetical protein